MRRIRVIGIGAGNPEHITVEGVRALNTVDRFFVVDKGSETSELSDLRTEICDRYVEPQREYRVIEIPDPARDRRDPAYLEAVEAWRARRATAWWAAIDAHLLPDDCGAFLVWGDPSLYDSTIAVLDSILVEHPDGFDYDVVPGISSVHALTARHRTSLNRIGGGVQVTTGRRLAAGLPDNVDDFVVMLDADCTFARLPEMQQAHIFWGAYLGTADEILVAGRVADVAGEIERLRGEARARKGWIMDTYLLRRPLDE